ncbi:hypothetical protein C451_05038 [Halococcus thailandensis JCM 13552]|uniref:Uncharacterized protein n=1 Tax=Halococcus thailandensis JCM 13552 TaxID=1227457 RepID=M0NCV6_9EURY|nr:hypothetical protein C451_05038 [Halococcus thailandensis JCM 13552]
MVVFRVMMDDRSIRELKMMIGGGALMSTGATLYTISGWPATGGFFVLAIGLILLVSGASGY